jgi:hypothetical protein
MANRPREIGAWSDAVPMSVPNGMHIMPAPLHGVFFAIPVFIVGLIRVFRVHQTLADIVYFGDLAFTHHRCAFFACERCMGRA